MPEIVALRQSARNHHQKLLGYKLLGGNTYIVSGKRTIAKMTLVKTL
jgi:hypothetical protein